ncbi:HflK protein [Canicola haemoglobinophilus]|uniref:HflK protein n=1 Tax=Canicola haemoglobinophilus TaxID=733 RepID=A0A377HZ29_9PAST|nr:HflK protein [Canicola haemoglobinophilus]
MSFNNSDQDPWGKPGSSGQKPENNQSHNGDKQSGWEQPKNQQKNTEQSPPDIEEIFNLLKNSVVSLVKVAKKVSKIYRL